MSARDEPMYLATARGAVRNKERVSHVVAQELVARIDSDAAALKAAQPRTITTAEELDKLPVRTIVAALTHSRNVPIVIVFQRGSIEHGGDGWCTPEAIGQIPSEKVFEFIALNVLPTVFTVLHDPEAQS